jgi:general secretion pathway protein J
VSRDDAKRVMSPYGCAQLSAEQRKTGSREWLVPGLAAGRAGFTLLELLISLTILAVVIVLIFGALRIGIRAWEKGERDVELQQRKRVVFDLVRQQIHSASSAKELKDEDGKTFLMKGDSSSLEFLSYLPALPSNEGRLVAVSYRVFEDEENGSRYLALAEKDAGVSSYLEEEEDGALTWMEEWDGTVKKGFPLAVRLSVTPADDAPPLVTIARLEQVKE